MSNQSSKQDETESSSSLEDSRVSLVNDNMEQKYLKSLNNCVKNDIFGRLFPEKAQGRPWTPDADLRELYASDGDKAYDAAEAER